MVPSSQLRLASAPQPRPTKRCVASKPSEVRSVENTDGEESSGVNLSCSHVRASA